MLCERREIHFSSFIRDSVRTARTPVERRERGATGEQWNCARAVAGCGVAEPYPGAGSAERGAREIMQNIFMQKENRATRANNDAAHVVSL